MEIQINSVPSRRLSLIPNQRVSRLAGVKIWLSLLIACNSFAAQATIITFDLRSSEAAIFLDDVNIGDFVIGGLIASFSALPGAPLDSVFNQTASRFGINTLGSSDDSPSLIDAVNGFSEFLSVSFSENVLLDKIVLSAFTPAEQAQVSIEGSPPMELIGLDAAVDVYDFSNYTIQTGEQLILAHSLGNGFSFDSIGVSLVSVAEPSSLALVLVAGLMVLLSRKQKIDRS